MVLISRNNSVEAYPLISLISLLIVENVILLKSLISTDVSLLNSLISRLSSLEVYADKSVISEEVND